MDEHPAYPVRIEGELDADLSRWLWLVKWLLAIPHYVVLAFLWLTLLVLTVVAFFAILFTGRYPRGIFDFNLGVLRWTWRVAFYSYGALGTDRYPPFTLDDVPDYPARLDVEYPERAVARARAREVVAARDPALRRRRHPPRRRELRGVARRTTGWGWRLPDRPDRDPRPLRRSRAPLHDAATRAGSSTSFSGSTAGSRASRAYVLLMRDEYPPFRLDQGGTETSGPPAGGARSGRRGAGRGAGHAAEERSGGGTAAVVLIVVGIIAGVIAFGLLAGGCALVAVDRTQRDDDGFLMSPSEDFSTPTYAVVSESADLDTKARSGRSTRSSAPSGSGATATRPALRRHRAAQPTSTPISRSVEHDVVTDLDASGDPEYSRRPGGAPPSPPGEEDVLGRRRRGHGRADARLGARGRRRGASS